MKENGGNHRAGRPDGHAGWKPAALVINKVELNSVHNKTYFSK